MLLSEILQEVSVMAPSDIPLNMQISWINQIQRELFRDYPLPEAAFTLTINPGEQFFALPDNCPEDRILSLVIDDKEIPFIEQFSEVEAGSRECFYSIALGELFIYPEPKHAATGVLYYRPRPRDLTVIDMSAAPDFPEDFHGLLAIGCAARIAAITPNLVNVYGALQGQYMALKEKADLMLTKRRQKRVYVARNWM